VTRRSLLQALAGALFQKKRTMPIPLVMSWLDLLGLTFPQVNYPTAVTRDAVTGRIAQTNGLTVYAFTIPSSDGSGFPVPGPLLARKSTDGGRAWGTPVQTSPFDASSRTGISPAVRSPIRDAFTHTDGKIYIPWFNANNFTGQPDPIEPFMLGKWDPAGDAWGTTQTFAAPSDVLAAQIGHGSGQLLWCRIRPDGSKILLWNRCVTEDDNRTRVEIYKDAGSGFVAMGSFDLGPFGSGGGRLVLYGSQMATDGTIHTFLLGTSDGGDTHQIYHASLSTADAISLLHLIDTVEVDGNGPPTYPVWNEPALSDTEIALGYPFQLGDPRFESPNELRVVRGDLTGDPLNPVFTIDSLTATILPSPSQDSADDGIKCFYDGSILNVTWQSDYGLSMVDGNPYTRIWIAQRISGAWGSPVVLFSPPAYPAGPFLPTNYLLVHYDVYPLSGGGFTGTVDVGYDATGSPNYGVGYAALAAPSGSYIRQLPRRGKQHSFMLG
jgi:hypothetical protein